MLVDPAPDNARRVLSARRQFGAGLSDLTESDLARPGIVFQIGVPPNRIDILTSITAVDFAELLIKNNRAVGRPQDLLDADLLEG